MNEQQPAGGNPFAFDRCARCGRIWDAPTLYTRCDLCGLAIGDARNLTEVLAKVEVPPKACRPVLIGVGMPAAMYLEEFGSQVWSTFGTPPYLVGSALHGKSWRDVDIRLILDDNIYLAWDIGLPTDMKLNAKWTSLCMAYAALGKHMTGLPIDFQIQQQTWANKTFPKPDHVRNPIGMVGLRFLKEAR